MLGIASETYCYERANSFSSCWAWVSAGGSTQACESICRQLEYFPAPLCARTEAAIYQQSRGDASCCLSQTFCFGLNKNVYASVVFFHFPSLFFSYLFPQGRGQMIVTLFERMEWNNFLEDEQILFLSKQPQVSHTLHRICHSVIHSSSSDLGFAYPFHQG